MVNKPWREHVGRRWGLPVSQNTSQLGQAISAWRPAWDVYRRHSSPQGGMGTAPLWGGVFTSLGWGPPNWEGFTPPLFDVSEGTEVCS